MRLAKLLVLLLLLTLILPGMVSARFSDLELSPERQTIERLVRARILEGYPDGTFRPTAPVTRGEFAESLVKALGQRPVDGSTGHLDLTNHPAQGFVRRLQELDILRGDQDLFRPQDTMTFREAGQWVALSLRLSSPEGQLDEAVLLNILESLEALPVDLHWEGTLRREDAAPLLWAVRSWQTAQAPLGAIDSARQTITTRPLLGSSQLMSVDADTLVIRNDRIAALDQLSPGDQAVLIYQGSDKVRVIRAYGAASGEDLAQALGSLTRTLGNNEILALLGGDTGPAEESILGSIHQQVSRYGVQREELEKAAQRDWVGLTRLAEERAVSTLANAFQVTTDLVQSLINWDLPKLREQLQQDLSLRFIQMLQRS